MTHRFDRREGLIGALLALILSLFVAACSSPTGDPITIKLDTDSGADDTAPAEVVLPDGGDCLKSSNSCKDTGSTETSVPADSGADTFVADTSSEVDSGADAGTLDAGTDSGMDSGTPETGETSVTDTGSDTATTEDAALDSAPADSGADTFVADTSSEVDSGADAGTTDAAVVDSGSPDTGVTDSGSDSGSVDTGTDAGADTAPTALSCGSWTRDTAFDSFKIDGTTNVVLVGGIWGTSAFNLYIPSADYGSKAVVAHWNGTKWTQESLPLATSVRAIWGTGDDIWVAAIGGKGRLFHRSGGIWTEDSSAPLASGFIGVWGSGSDVFLAGTKFGAPYVWRKTGSTWTEMTLPTFTNTPTLRRLWGIDANNVFVAGSYNDSSGARVKGMLLYFNGTKWTEVATPSDSLELYDVSGSSIDNLFVVGQNKSSQAVAYELTSKMASWSTTVTSSMAGYGVALSTKPGTVLAGGKQSATSPGSARTTTIDKMGSPSTTSVDSYAYSTVQLWLEPGTTKVHLVTSSAPGDIARHYTATCSGM